MNKIHKFFKDESGASALEYGLLVALIPVVIIGVVAVLGNTDSTQMNAAATAFGR